MAELAPLKLKSPKQGGDMWILNYYLKWVEYIY